jgi:hypothetical protein
MLYNILDSSVTKVIVEKVFKILHAIMKYYISCRVVDNSDFNYKGVNGINKLNS